MMEYKIKVGEELIPAEKIGENLFRLKGISIFTEYNYDDIVEVKEEENDLIIKSLVERKYKGKDVIFYDNQEQLKQFLFLVEITGSACIIYKEPQLQKGLRGALLVAFNENFSPYLNAEQIGIYNPHENFLDGTVTVQ